MNNSGRDYDNIASNLRDTIHSWCSNYIDFCVKDFLMRTTNKSFMNMGQTNDYDNHNHLVEETVRKSITQYLKQLDNEYDRPDIHMVPDSSESSREDDNADSSLNDMYFPTHLDSEVNANIEPTQHMAETRMLENINDEPGHPASQTEPGCSRSQGLIIPSVREIAIQPQLIETHDCILIRINIPKGINPDDFRIGINETHAAIRWESGYVEQIVKLPQDIIREQAEAAVKDSILEIKIPRMQAGNVRKIDI